MLLAALLAPLAAAERLLRAGKRRISRWAEGKGDEIVILLPAASVVILVWVALRSDGFALESTLRQLGAAHGIGR